MNYNLKYLYTYIIFILNYFYVFQLAKRFFLPSKCKKNKSKYLFSNVKSSAVFLLNLSSHICALIFYNVQLKVFKTVTITALNDPNIQFTSKLFVC